MQILLSSAHNPFNSSVKDILISCLLGGNRLLVCICDYLILWMETENT